MTGARAAVHLKPRRAIPARVLWLVVVLAAVAIWLGLGSVRATTIARDHFAGAHGPGARLVNVQIEGSGPAFPPFWSVTVSGDVVEAGSTTPAYRSHMVLWVESITGLVFVGGSG